MTQSIEKAGDKPLFIVLYWLNPHAPYSPPKLHDLYTDPSGPQGEFGGEERDKKLPGDFSHQEINSGEVVLEEAQWKQLKALYDGELHSNDQRMQNGIMKYQLLRPWNDAVFVMTSDHGEFFNERSQMRVWHGWLTHENQRYPLIIKAPGQKGVDIQSQVRGVDVFSMRLLRWTKCPVPLMQGQKEAHRPNLGASHYSGGLMFLEWEENHIAAQPGQHLSV